MSKSLFRVFRPLSKQLHQSSRLCSTFKSSIHTDNLYPGSNLDAKFAKFDIEKLPTKDQTFSGYIPMNELDFSYSHSSGPGGSNVNKVTFTFNFQKSKNGSNIDSFQFQTLTKVSLKFNLDSASWLTSDVKEIIKMKHSNQLTKEGCLVVKSDRTRSRQLNQADALQKLRHFVWSSVDEVRTYLEKSQLSQVEEEKLVKARQKAARERLKSKRHNSLRLESKRSNNPDF